MTKKLFIGSVVATMKLTHVAYTVQYIVAHRYGDAIIALNELAKEKYPGKGVQIDAEEVPLNVLKDIVNDNKMEWKIRNRIGVDIKNDENYYYKYDK